MAESTHRPGEIDASTPPPTRWGAWQSRHIDPEGSIDEVDPAATAQERVADSTHRPGAVGSISARRGAAVPMRVDFVDDVEKTSVLLFFFAVRPR